MSLLIYHFLELNPIICLTYVIGFGPWELFHVCVAAKLVFLVQFVLLSLNMPTFLSLIVGWLGNYDPKNLK